MLGGRARKAKEQSHIHFNVEKGHSWIKEIQWNENIILLFCQNKCTILFDIVLLSLFVSFVFSQHNIIY